MQHKAASKPARYSWAKHEWIQTTAIDVDTRTQKKKQPRK